MHIINKEMMNKYKWKSKMQKFLESIALHSKTNFLKKLELKNTSK